jgi:predicted outer membrane protein
MVAVIVATLVGWGLVGTVKSADDKGAPVAGAPAAAAEAPAAGDVEKTQNQWVQRSNEELEKADSLEKLFLIGCAEQDIFELLLTQTAVKQAQSDKVKDLARQLHKDDEELTRAVQKVIEQKGLIMPQGISPILQHELKLIRAQQGEQFDLAFVSAIKATRAKIRSRLSDMSKVSKDPAIKELATSALATVQQQQQEIRATATALGL